MDLKDKTLREIISYLVRNYNYIFDEIVADIADEVKEILDNEYEENYCTGKQVDQDDWEEEEWLIKFTILMH